MTSVKHVRESYLGCVCKFVCVCLSDREYCCRVYGTGQQLVCKKLLIQYYTHDTKVTSFTQTHVHDAHLVSVIANLLAPRQAVGSPPSPLPSLSLLSTPPRFFIPTVRTCTTSSATVVETPLDSVGEESPPLIERRR